MLVREGPATGTRLTPGAGSELRRCYHAEHTAVADALRDRDPIGAGACAGMRTRLQNVCDNLLGRH